MNNNLYAAIGMALYEFAGNNVSRCRIWYHHNKAKADNVECQIRNYDKETIRQR